LQGANGAQLYVESAGLVGGPTLVFTHGAGTDSAVWYLAKRALADHFELVMWDLPGLGKSHGGPIRLGAYADNLAVLITSLDRPVVLVGHSMGAMTIQTLALRSSELFTTHISGVALLNTTYTDPLRTMAFARVATALKPLLYLFFALEVLLLPLSWLSAWQSWLSGATHLANRLTFGKNVTRTQLNHAALLGNRNLPASIARGNIAMMRWDATEAAAKFPFPILIIAGAGDIVTKPSASAEIAGRAIEPHLEEVDYANHMSFLDHADQYHAAIASYAQAAFERIVPVAKDAKGQQ
jgi:pimeloyl-ACP methyl ester carboxylesterase